MNSKREKQFLAYMIANQLFLLSYSFPLIHDKLSFFIYFYLFYLGVTTMSDERWLSPSWMPMPSSQSPNPTNVRRKFMLNRHNHVFLSADYNLDEKNRERLPLPVNRTPVPQSRSPVRISRSPSRHDRSMTQLSNLMNPILQSHNDQLHQPNGDWNTSSGNVKSVRRRRAEGDDRRWGTHHLTKKEFETAIVRCDQMSQQSRNGIHSSEQSQNPRVLQLIQNDASPIRRISHFDNVTAEEIIQAMSGSDRGKSNSKNSAADEKKEEQDEISRTDAMRTTPFQVKLRQMLCTIKRTGTRTKTSSRSARKISQRNVFDQVQTERMQNGITMTSSPTGQKDVSRNMLVALSNTNKLPFLLSNRVSSTYISGCTNDVRSAKSL